MLTGPTMFHIVRHILVNNGSDNDLLLVQGQAITWTNKKCWLIINKVPREKPYGNLHQIVKLSTQKIHSKTSSAKCFHFVFFDLDLSLLFRAIMYTNIEWRTHLSEVAFHCNRKPFEDLICSECPYLLTYKHVDTKLAWFMKCTNSGDNHFMLRSSQPLFCILYSNKLFISHSSFTRLTQYGPVTIPRGSVMTHICCCQCTGPHIVTVAVESTGAIMVPWYISHKGPGYHDALVIRGLFTISSHGQKQF